MNEHEHKWDAIPFQMGRYACACGAEAWRHLPTGELRTAKHKKARESLWSAMDRTHNRSSEGGRVGRLPTLAEQEKDRSR